MIEKLSLVSALFKININQWDNIIWALKEINMENKSIIWGLKQIICHAN